MHKCTLESWPCPASPIWLFYRCFAIFQYVWFWAHLSCPFAWDVRRGLLSNWLKLDSKLQNCKKEKCSKVHIERKVDLVPFECSFKALPFPEVQFADKHIIGWFWAHLLENKCAPSIPHMWVTLNLPETGCKIAGWQKKMQDCACACAFACACARQLGWLVGCHNCI